MLLRDEPWEEVSTLKLIASALGLGLFFYIVATDRDSFIGIIDHANLAFHEAGHVIFGVFGPTMDLYGGTLGQLVFPAVAIVSFWWKRSPVSFALGWVWLFENFLNIARYIADARAHLLPLVGGGGHDWTALLTRWGALTLDTRLAAGVKGLGWAGMVAALAWLGWRWYNDHEFV